MEYNSKNKQEIIKVKICNRTGIYKIKFYTHKIQTTINILRCHLLVMCSQQLFNRQINKIFRVIIKLNQGIKMIKIAKIQIISLIIVLRSNFQKLVIMDRLKNNKKKTMQILTMIINQNKRMNSQKMRKEITFCLNNKLLSNSIFNINSI